MSTSKLQAWLHTYRNFGGLICAAQDRDDKLEGLG